MKIANVDGRAVLITSAGLIDIARASADALPSDPNKVIAKVADVKQFYANTIPEPNMTLTEAELLEDLSILGPPVTAPRQIFAVGLNYADHSAETGLALPNQPLIFTKFASALAGPGDPIPLPTDTCDWEVEMVAVIGRRGRNITPQDALAHIAGFCVGQDISERTSQMKGTPPQFSLAKSYRGFSPIGPWITTIDELDNPNDLSISTTLDGEVVQNARTSDMIFSVERLVSHLSSVCELLPGDLIFTGTPAGVGYSRTPARFLTPDCVIQSSIEGLGQLRNPCTSAS